MKKVFLSLAVIATLTVVSCKQAEATDAAAADSMVVETPEAPVVEPDSLSKETAKADSIAAATAKADSLAAAAKGKK